jgi:hypothetical protein
LKLSAENLETAAIHEAGHIVFVEHTREALLASDLWDETADERTAPYSHIIH